MKRHISIKWYRSVSFRLPMLFVSSTLLIILLVVSIVFVRFRERMIEDYSRMGKGVTNLMAMEIDPNKTDYYLEENFSSEEYNRILDRLYDLKDNYPGVLYMYVYRIKRDGAVVIFDLDSTEGAVDADKPGDIYKLDKAFIDHIDELTAGKQTPALTGQTEDGYLLTYCKPLFDSEGNYQCHVCVDFSIEQLHHDDIRFVSEILLFLIIAVILILLIDIYIVQKNIAGPLSTMKRTTDNFSYETDSDHENNIRLMEKLNIHTQDEIEDIYHVFIVFMKNNLLYMKNFLKAQDDIKEKDAALGQISRTAYFDALTEAGNKAAYNLAAEALDRSAKPFAVAVFDINNLKYINDHHGHKEGDSYICGCCAVLTDVFGSENVYRVGGDEFAILLSNNDYTDREKLFGQAAARFEETYAQTEKPVWERCSMAGGMAERTEAGETVGQIFSIADERMYQNKLRFKEKYGSYR